MEGNIAVLLGQVLCVQCVDVDKPVQHLELVTFHKILRPWSKTEGDEEVF